MYIEVQLNKNWGRQGRDGTLKTENVKALDPNNGRKTVDAPQWSKGGKKEECYHIDVSN